MARSFMNGWIYKCEWMIVAMAIAAGVAEAGDVVYVESNVSTGTGNSILAFRRDAQGALTPLAGSPFSTGGLGVSPSFALGPYDSDQNIVVDRNRNLMYAVNGGSDSIAVMRIGHDGGLTPVPGSPFASGGSNPVSVGLAGNVLCVVNKDQDPDHPGVVLPNYTTMRISPSGRLTPIKFGTFTIDAGASPTQALVGPSSGLVFGDDFMGGVIRSFKLGANGRLLERDVQALPPSEFAGSGAPPFPLGLAAHPKRPYLYVGFVTINKMGVYKYAANGRLDFVRSVSNSGQAICWVSMNAKGSRIYTSNTADSSISVYDSTRPDNPVEIQHLILKAPGAAYQIALDHDEHFFYAVTQRDSETRPVLSNSLHVMTVAKDGTLTEVESSPTIFPFTDGSRPQGVVAP